MLLKLSSCLNAASFAVCALKESPSPGRRFGFYEAHTARVVIGRSIKSRAVNINTLIRID